MTLCQYLIIFIVKVNMVTLTLKQLPKRLETITTPPRQLFALGDVGLLESDHTLSVVGTRKVTTYGRQITTHLVEEVARYGVVIVSGLALGIDSIAHNAALSVDGKTIAVLPSGLDTIYPASHRNLAIRILENGGLLISEYEIGMPALKQNFIARNRIVSGLGDGVLITEASRQSGTIHTANFALEQGKTVMAVPGNITSSQSEGTNNLIKTGAITVTSSDDILSALCLQINNRAKEVVGSNQEETTILELIKQGITDSNAILHATKMDSRLFNQTLSMLEITGKIRPLGTDNWDIA